jgi:hypothetical protein
MFNMVLMLADRSTNNRFVLYRTKVDGVLVETVSRQGSYDIVARRVVQDSDLETPTVFACELRIPEVDYTVTKLVVYYPGKWQYE